MAGYYFLAIGESQCQIAYFYRDFWGHPLENYCYSVPYALRLDGLYIRPTKNVFHASYSPYSPYWALSTFHGLSPYNCMGNVWWSDRAVMMPATCGDVIGLVIERWELTLVRDMPYDLGSYSMHTLQTTIDSSRQPVRSIYWHHVQLYTRAMCYCTAVRLYTWYPICVTNLTAVIAIHANTACMDQWQRDDALS